MDFKALVDAFKSTPPGPLKLVAARAVAAAVEPMPHFKVVVNVKSPQGYYEMHMRTGPGWDTPIQITKEEFDAVLAGIVEA